MHDTIVSKNEFNSSNLFFNKIDELKKSIKSYSKKSPPLLIGVVLSMLVGGLTLVPNIAYSDEEQKTLEQIRLEAEEEFANEVLKAKSILNEIKNNPNSDEQDIELAMIEYNKSVAIAKQVRDEKIQQAQIALDSTPIPKITLAEARKQLKSTIDAAQEQLQKTIESAKATYDSAINNAFGNEDLEKHAESEYEQAVKTAKETYNKIIYEATKQYQKMKDLLNV